MNSRSPLTLLASYGTASVLIYLAAFTMPYPLASGLEKPLLQFTWLTGPSFGPTAMLIASVAALFILYVGALRAVTRLQSSRAAVLLVIVFGVLSAAALVAMYPVFSLDVFYYMAADRIWSVFRENPFIVPPLQAAHDPFFPYTAWGHYPLPYGPGWPWITEATSRFGGGDVARTLLAFKLLGALGYLLCLPLVAWAAAGLHRDRALAALCIFAWNPLVLLELVGGAHNDAVALVPAALAVGFWTRRATIAGAMAGLASFLVKATLGVLVPAFLWASFTRARRSRRLVWWSATHLLPAFVLYGVAWLPFTSGGLPPGFLREADQYYHSLTALTIALLPPDLKVQGLRGTQLVLSGVFLVFYASQLKALSAEGRPALHAIWRLVVVFFLVISPFSSPWYLVWPTLFAAILAERHTTILNTLLCIGALGTYLIQFVVRPLAMPPLTWAHINALGFAIAVGPCALGWMLLQRERIPLVVDRRPAPVMVSPERAEL
jgi:hypothetical protein